ncbi:vacuole membrane protein 1 isoform X1 [Phlebotomus argentipes]|uniref:vacuole membrane protein 1 isoform X1 n=2 Tax=Phlebotomus argentipes TaxID=94469 RepID=UPI0028937123|nr:vacuole membrane protein 1 isoform X1 [Phlebotomus argentipes]
MPSKKRPTAANRQQGVSPSGHKYASGAGAKEPQQSMANGDVASGGHVLTAKQRQQLDKSIFLASLTKNELQNECRKRGLKITGNKMELLQRLGYKMSHHNHNQQSTVTSSTSGTSRQNQQKKTPNGTAMDSFVRKQSARDREKERNERKKIVIWRHPILTSKYCALECMTLMQTYGRKLADHKKLMALLVAVVAMVIAMYHVPGRHQTYIDLIRVHMWFVTYWVGLGVLSSVGLGTGLHTFLLYLGPHIASVTMAAYECNSLNFPKPPYPDEIICPEKVDPTFIPSLWNIMGKVRVEAFLWGAGTALGELPPYFMAKAARLSGYDPDDAEDLQEFEELKKKREQGADLNYLDRAKLFMERLVERVGFPGILACASIPNPLFDLAGITCGHFLVPFWTFFGATLIGKAVIKMHIQKIFVIIAFNETLIAKALDLLALIPFMGKRLQEPFKAFLQNQKARLHRGPARKASETGNFLARLFEKFVVAMIVYFVVSIINSLAQSYHKRIHKKGGKVHRKVARD